MKNIDCVMFDLDGVLIDTCDWHYDALNAALQQHLGFTISRADHESEFNGLPTRIKLKMLKIPDRVANEVLITKQAITRQYIDDRVRPNFSKIHMMEE